MFVENDGKGLNLTVQVLDGIMCHNGEILEPIYKPMKKDQEEFLKEFGESYKNLKNTRKCSPMTLEGCVVRISDMIAYVGRDIEDSINLGLFRREELPKEITDVLGNSNKEIINTITTDIINESMNKPYIKISDKVFESLLKLKKFNHQNIYAKSMSDEEREYYKKGMNKLYSYYLSILEKEDKSNIIYQIFLNNQVKEYLENTTNKRKVIDFIAGMTDELLLSEIVKMN